MTAMSPDNSEPELKSTVERSAHLQLSDIANDELHRAAFATEDIGVWKYDLPRQKMSWGPEVEAILGVRPSSSPEETFFGLMHPDDRPHLMAEFQKCLQERQPFRLDYRIPRLDGTVRWMNSTGQPYFDSDGRPTHVIGTVHDITNQKMAELWLQGQNDLLRSIAIGMPVQEVFQAIVAMLRNGLDVAMVAFLKLDGQGGLRFVAGVNVPEAYINIIESINLSDEECLCRSSVLAAAPQFSDDVASDPRLAYLKEVIDHYSWASCCAFPVLAAPLVAHRMPTADERGEAHANPRAVGLFAIFRSQRGRPDARELDKIAQAAHLANIVIARDQTHQSLQESEHRFRELANAMPQLVWTSDPNGQCTYSNRLLKETIGESALDNWMSVVHPDDRSMVLERFVEAYRTGQPYTVEHRLLVKGTEMYRWFLARAIPSRDAKGDINVWYGAATDIDDLKRIESALREERDRLTAIAATCPSVLFTCIQQPDGTPTVPYAAPTLSDLLGVDLKIIESNAYTLIERVDAEDLPRLQQALRAATDRMTSLEITVRVHHRNKGIVWVECRASPCHLADGTIGWHGTLTDVTRRKMLEARLLQSEKLEAVGRLAGGIAHDFNNMLTVIIGACHVLELQLTGRSSETENIEAIRQAAMRAASLTKQLLAFSRQQPTAPQRLRLNAVINQAEGILARLVGNSIHLKTELADDLKMVFIDPSQMEQILVNLVINSRDAIADQGEIRIETRNVLRSAASESADGSPAGRLYVEICVSDDGCGMSQETLVRIFDPFFTTKPIGKGTGLGLAVVHGIVTQNEGLIEVDSRLTKGTTIRILLPAVEATSVDENALQDTGPLQGGTEGVLVVDDEPAIGQMTSKTLRSLGYSVFTASSPEEALKLFESHAHSIDILLTDLLMPGCNGVELANRLIETKCNLKVIVMSGHRTSSFDHADVARTGYRFLPKPYTTMELSSALRSAITSSS